MEQDLVIVCCGLQGEGFGNTVGKHYSLLSEVFSVAEDLIKDPDCNKIYIYNDGCFNQIAKWNRSEGWTG